MLSKKRGWTFHMLHCIRERKISFQICMIRENLSVEIHPQGRKESAYVIKSISWLLMTWRRKEPGHQQAWYWPSVHVIFYCLHTKGQHHIGEQQWKAQLCVSQPGVGHERILGVVPHHGHSLHAFGGIWAHCGNESSAGASSTVQTGYVALVSRSVDITVAVGKGTCFEDDKGQHIKVWKQNGKQFAANNFKCMLPNENFGILI